MPSFTVTHHSNSFTCPRAEPDVSCHIFAKAIKNGEIVTGEVIGDWLKIDTGYIQLKYCESVASCDDFEATHHVFHSNGGIHFRAAPIDKREFIGTRIPNGTPIQCIREIPPQDGISWALMETDADQRGWVKISNCVRILPLSGNPASSARIAPTHASTLAAAKSPIKPAAIKHIASQPIHHIPQPIAIIPPVRASSRAEPQLMVLLQLRGKRGFFPDMLGLPGGCHDSKDANSRDCAIREMVEETSFRVTNATYVDCGRSCDYYMSTDPATFNERQIKDAHETQKISGTWFESYVRQLGGRIATHGHAWIPVYKIHAIPADKFMTGIKNRIEYGLFVMKGGKPRSTPTATKNGFIILFNTL